MTTQEAKDKVIQEILHLYHRGYDGPFMGDEIEPLFKCIAQLEKLLEENNMNDLDLFENLPKVSNGMICVWNIFEADCSEGISIFKLFGVQDVPICKVHYAHHVKVMTLYHKTEIDIEDIIVMSVEEIDKKISGIK